ncbi:PREDICTED: uncharacterized protein LOC109330893 [Lupinus angustifolius]|uniref:uncharacterized protein LOC109330893 n=1 Tax=Lupinus angustifolius TaxID=3871 RepID=UPI00092FD998|nr:PREDICTED: uncharacterized protein LOC109330893 [Lupinus angustifolius]
MDFGVRSGFQYTWARNMGNIVEYEACVLGLEAAFESKINSIEVFGDSALVIHQVKGEWETRDTKLIPYRDHIKKLIDQFEKIDLYHIPREDNRLADALATLSSMFQIGEKEMLVIRTSSKDQPAYCCEIESESDGKPWYHDIMTYLKSKEYPLEATENDKRTLRRLAMGFFLNENVLYKRNHDMTLLRCVEAKEAEKIIQGIHEEMFGTHTNGHSIARKIMRAGYFWLTMESDCCDHV